jgi:tetratricopeptide (TPR) repeat protein
MSDEEIPPEGSGQNLLLHEAIEALRKGDRERARDILTRLLKTDQANPMCWIWLSTAVDTPKERLYCLQTALQLDPQNAAAKRGLTLLGGLAPDDGVPPFPLNHPRSWEDTLAIPQEPKEERHAVGRPLVRLFVIVATSLAVLAVAYFGFLAPNAFAVALFNAGPRRLFVTITFTPTGGANGSVPTAPQPTPLEVLLHTDYTPTPLYVVTQHPIDTESSFKAGLRFFAAKDYGNAIGMFQQVLNGEPKAADAYYYIGEAYRMQREYVKARAAYQSAINADPDFAPGYLGRALATIKTNPDEDVSSDFDSAVNLDPQFIAAFIERGAYKRNHNDPNGAIVDEQNALNLDPDSALAYLYMAQAQLDIGQNETALASALQANKIDLTLVPAYLVLAQAYIANGQVDKATGALQTYTVYSPDDKDAYLTLATVYNAIGEYQKALESVNLYLNANPRDPKAFNQRGLAYLNLDNASLAEIDFKTAAAYDPKYFDPAMGLALAYYAQDHPNNAYIQANLTAEPLMTTEAQKAQVYYWEATFLEKMGSHGAAIETWRHLLLLSANAMPEEWRNEAFLHLGIKPSSTPTLRYTRTPTPSQTPTP